MSNFDSDDHRFMAQAIALAKKGRFTTRPNPNVGCVIVRAGKVLASGFHYRAGEGHAEVNALQQIEHSAVGAIAYVTLEPCSHHGRTGPCAQALLSAGVSRVVCAMQDPNPQVAGRGIAMLRAAGVLVDVGLLQQQSEQLNLGFIKRMSKQRPLVTIKMAMSIDGRTAMQNGESQWITGSAARSNVQKLRAKSCAIITGIGSIEQDNSSLTVRTEELGLAEADEITKFQPLRVVLDPANRISQDARILSQPGRTLRVIAGTLVGQQQDVISLPDANGRIDLDALLEYLATQEQCNSVLVEAGATLCGSFVEEQLFDQLYLYMAPKLLGSSARPLFELPLQTMAQQKELTLLDQRVFGNDIRFIYAPVSHVN